MLKENPTRDVGDPERHGSNASSAREHPKDSTPGRRRRRAAAPSSRSLSGNAAEASAVTPTDSRSDAYRIASREHRMPTNDRYARQRIRAHEDAGAHLPPHCGRMSSKGRSGSDTHP